ncbi:MAG: cytochrome c oxidase assembly protein, partial [Thermomicrobiaceae bacterium]|nr:cytochrome c oxidase assembly protein [Thermomicrobiaceae bacterium]
MLLPILHGTANGPFLTAWTFSPAIVLGLLVAAVGYGLALRQLRRAGRREPPVWQPLCFYGGLLSLAVALLGPLDTFNDELFSLHMAQHLVLVQVAAPLLLLGQPVQLLLRAVPARRSRPVLRAVLRPGPIRWVLTALTNGVVAFLLFNGAMIIWHVPAFYDAALRSDAVHEFEHITFLVTALLYWWPIIAPVPRHHRLSPIAAMGSLFFTMSVSTAIGAILTLANSVLYPFYLTAAHPWGLTAETDQQIAGLIMWVGSGLLYFGVLLAMMIHTFGFEDREAEEAQAAAASQW